MHKGSDQRCNIHIASKASYGFVRSPEILIKIEGDGLEETFKATAKHEKLDEVITIDMRGKFD